MVQLITIVEGFYACGVAASVYAQRRRRSKTVTPDPVFANIGKLLLANQIYEMHRIAHYVSGGLIVTLPGPTRTTTPRPRRSSPTCCAPTRRAVRQADRGGALIEDLTASYQGGWYSVISLHGGGSPEAMQQEIWRNYPVGDKVDWSSVCSSAMSLDRRPQDRRRQPGKCCDDGLHAAEPTTMVALPPTTQGEHAVTMPPRPTPSSTAARSRIATRSGASRRS
jgi:4-hydroxybutyryl-CoA dehydratase/vinylacetyl-CoA-Delta-isomerase